MIYPGVSPETWADRRAIPLVLEDDCKACAKKVQPAVPVLMKGYVGYEFRCPCNGIASTSYVFFPTGDMKGFWRKVLSGER